MIDYLQQVLFWIGLEVVAAVTTLWLLWEFTKFVARMQVRRMTRTDVVLPVATG